MKKKNKIILGLFVLMIFYLYFENTNLSISNHSIVNSKIPNEFNNYKIAQISDFHNTKFDSLKGSLINELEMQKPDIIVLTGDFVDSYKPDVEVSIDFIKKIKHIAPIYFISGNHDFRLSHDNYDNLYGKLKVEGVNVLENEVEVIKIKNESINLLGIDDPSKIVAIEADEEKVIEESVSNIKYNKNLYTILLSHRPEKINNYAKQKMDLVFSGHAHGGQIRIPLIGGIIAPDQGLFPEYTNGMHIQDSTTLIISRGIGNSLFPFRVNNRPELVIVTLSNE